MKKIIYALPLLFLLSCQNNGKDTPNSTTQNSTQTNNPDSKPIVTNETASGHLRLDPIIVEFNFDKDIAQKMADAGELVQISLSISTSKELTKDEEKELGDYFTEKHEGIFASAEKQVQVGDRALFDKIMIDKKIIDIVGKDNLEIQLNIYSARKAFENNIINCNYVSTSYIKAIAAPIQVNCGAL